MTRHRETLLYQNTNTVYRTYNGGATFSPTSATSTSKKEIWDCNTQFYLRSLKNGGVLPYQPVQIDTWSDVYTPASDRHDHATPALDQWGPFYIISDDTDKRENNPFDPAAAAYVVNGAIAAAKQEALDILTFIAELPKTMDMVANRMTRVFDIADKIANKAVRSKPWKPVPPRRGRRTPRTAREAREEAAWRARMDKQVNKDTLDAFQNMWLEGRYGWRPLASEIDNVIKGITDYQADYVRRRVSYTVDLGKSTSERQDRGGSYRDVQYERIGSQIYRGFAMAKGLFGTGAFASFPVAAWELTPLSFLVDRFVDYGSAIAAITPTPGVALLASGYSIHSETTQSTSYAYATKPGTGYTVVDVIPGVNLHTLNRYERVPSGVLVPGLLPRLDTLVLADIVALVSQRARRLQRFL